MTRNYRDIFDSPFIEWTPDSARNHDETVLLWALIQYADFIEKVGWIDHTCDWDNAFEVTLKEGQVIAAMSIEPRIGMEDTEFNADTGINELIGNILITHDDVAWTEPESWQDEMTPGSPSMISLDAIERIVYT